VFTVTLSIAKSNAVELNTTLLKGAPAKERVPSGKAPPPGTVPLAEETPTDVAPLNAFKFRGIPAPEFVAKISEMLVCGALKRIDKLRLFEPAGPGSNKTPPVRLVKKVGSITKPPGSPELLKVADKPLTVSVNCVEVPTTSESKLKVTTLACRLLSRHGSMARVKTADRRVGIRRSSRREAGNDLRVFPWVMLLDCARLGAHEQAALCGFK
jgi:hypothetical protein